MQVGISMSSALRTSLSKPSGKLLMLALLFALALGWLFLAGMVFLIMVSKDPNQAELLTLYQYWYYYRTAPGVLIKIYQAGGISLPHPSL